MTIFSIERYFRILFLTKNISRDNLKQFAEDHIQRLTVNNPGGIFTSLLVNVTNAYTSFFGDLSHTAIAGAVQKARTAGMSNSKDKAIQFIRDAHGLITYTFRDTPEIISTFYPHGMDEYTHSDLGNAELIINRFIQAATDNSGVLPVNFVGDITNLRNVFVANRTTQLLQKGTLSADRSHIVGTQEGLCIELTRNVLLIAAHFVGHESKAHVYFDQGIIDPHHASKVLLQVRLDIPAGETVNIPHPGFVMQPDFILILLNPHDSSVAAFSFGPDANTLANAKTLDAGSSFSGTVTKAEFSTMNTFLNLRSETNMPVKGLVVKVMKP